MKKKNIKVSRRSAIATVGAAMISPATSSAAIVSSTQSNNTEMVKVSGYTSAMNRDDNLVVEGDDITVSFELIKCVHARFCTLWQPNVYPGKEPWILPNADSAEEVSAIVRACPSGALQYYRKDGVHQELPPKINAVYVRENGPLAVRASINLDGEEIGNRATFCRCGQSGNMPFCDNSHTKANFQATGIPPVLTDREPLVSRDGTVEIEVEKNGPLHVSGNLEMCSGTGSSIGTMTSAVLCRCGQSKNKPFCDGSHADVGFIEKG